jgi:hypothetical protein
MDPHHIFAAATATASQLQLASSKAASRARGDIAATMETRFEGLTKQFQEEVGQGPNAESVSQFTQAYRTVVSRTINGAEVVKREIRREDGGYRAYVLMRMPIGEAQETLLKQVQAQETAYSSFRSSGAYDTLEQDVNGYRQRAKDRAARRQGQMSSQTGARTQPSGQEGQADQTTQGEVTEEGQPRRRSASSRGCARRCSRGWARPTSSGAKPKTGWTARPWYGRSTTTPSG